MRRSETLPDKQLSLIPPARWVDSAVAALVLAWPAEAWSGGVVLYADNGTRPVTFDTPAALRAAIARNDIDIRTEWNR